MYTLNIIPPERLDQTLNAVFFTSYAFQSLFVWACVLLLQQAQACRAFNERKALQMFKPVGPSTGTRPGKSQSLFIAGCVYIYVHRVVCANQRFAAV